MISNSIKHIVSPVDRQSGKKKYVSLGTYDCVTQRYLQAWRRVNELRYCHA